MRLLVSGSVALVAGLARCYPGRLGVLLAPRNHNGPAAAAGLPFGADNGAYSGFDPARFRRLLARVAGRPGLLWVVCPDVVADARATLDLFGRWREEVARAGPVAFVAQDGQEDLPVPWDGFACLFVGGSTEWKLSRAAAGLVAEARRRGKLVHMGRVTTLRRMRVAFDLGCDSIDGSNYSRMSDKFLAWGVRHLERLHRQGALF